MEIYTINIDYIRNIRKSKPENAIKEERKK